MGISRLYGVVLFFFALIGGTYALGYLVGGFAGGLVGLAIGVVLCGSIGYYIRPKRPEEDYEDSLASLREMPSSALDSWNDESREE